MKKAFIHNDPPPSACNSLRGKALSRVMHNDD